MDKSGDVHEQSCSSEIVPVPHVPLDSSVDPIAHSEKMGLCFV